MRFSRGFVRPFLAGLFCTSFASDAGAELLIVDTPGDPPAVAYAELAYAEGAGTPVTWLSLRVRRGPVAVVAALPGDALAEPALDAWFAALEATASPNVVLPRDATNCGQTGRFVHVAWPRADGASATELSVQTAADVLAVLAEQGLEPSVELPKADRYLVWSWAAADAQQTTRTLRIAGGSAPLTLLPGAAFPVLVSGVTRGARVLPTELSNDELVVTFVADQRPSTDYQARLREFLAARPEPLLEARARGPLFDWSIYDDSISLASLVRSYATRAASEMPGLDSETCAAQLRALRDDDAPSASACGEASDAGLAFAAAGSELTTLQRFVVSGLVGFAPGDASDGGLPNPPVLRARLLDQTACEIQDLPPSMVEPPVRSGGGVSGPNGNTTVVVEETVVIDETEPGEVHCGGSTEPEPQDGYYADDSVDCSSDTSSTSESDSSDCSGDSSSSSDSSDDCSGDSSSSSDSSDPGCDGGGESSGYDGDTCTGSAAPGAERTEQSRASLTSGARAHRPRRLKTSLWSLAFVAVSLPIRRRKRGHCTSG